MTGEQTKTNETAPADQQIVSTEIGDLTSADFETTREKWRQYVRDCLINDTKTALYAVNSADNCSLQSFLVKRDLKIMVK